MLFLFLAHFLSSNMFLFGKVILDFASPLLVVGLRTLLGGLIAIVLYFFNQERRSRLSRFTINDYFLIILFGFFYVFLKTSLSFWGMQYMSSGKAAFIFNLSPFVSAFFSYLFFNELMTQKKWIGITIGFIGVTMTLMHRSSCGMEAGGFCTFISLAEASIIGAVIANSLGIVIARYLSRERKVPVFFFNSISLISSSMMSFAGMAYLGESWMITTDKIYFFTSLLVAISVLSIVALHIKIVLLKKYSTTMMEFTSFVMPLSATILGYLFLNEDVTWHFAISFVVVIMGLYIFYQEELRQGYIVKPHSHEDDELSSL